MVSLCSCVSHWCNLWHVMIFYEWPFCLYNFGNISLSLSFYHSLFGRNKSKPMVHYEALIINIITNPIISPNHPKTLVVIVDRLCLGVSVSITVTSWWAQWCLKSPALPLFTQPFIQAQIKEKKIKALGYWPLCGEFTSHRWIPRTWPVMWKMFPFDDVIMLH